MSIEFTSGLEKPSNLVALPGNFVRPAFEQLYGFDVPPAETLFNVTTRDTEVNILASTPTNPSGEVNIAFGTDTYEFYIYTPSGSWLMFNNDF